MTTDLREQLQDGLGGAYTLERELGGGGMSRVFVAGDTALGRKVVVKVLRADLAEGLSVERFKREIQLAARLQHPHIVPLLTAGALSGGVLYYTMPLVDGESLRDRLERDGGLPVPEIIGLLRDVASALAYAHRQHIVHRDIKPENILLSHGSAVVADFGIAKAIHAARTEELESARHTSTLTQQGTSLGTPSYMAPEQAAGDTVDHRADLYALGVVAYEMLAGRPPFSGRTAQQLLAAHAVEAPEPIVKRRAAVPAGLGALVMCLLEKHPGDRPQAAEDVLRALEGAAVTTTAALPSAYVSSGARTHTSETRTRWRQRLTDPLVLALGAVAVGSLGVLAWLLGTSRPAVTPSLPHVRVALELPPETSIGSGGAAGNSMVFSPDGASLVYRGGSPPRLFVRRLDDLTPHALAGTELATNPQFSPDGRWIAFLRSPELLKVPVNGGPVVPILSDAARFAWAPDGSIIFAKAVGGFLGTLWRVGSTGGPPEQITMPDSALGGSHGSPTVLPDGRTVLFTVISSRGMPTLAAVRLGDRKVIPLDVAGGSATYLPGGYLQFVRPDGSIGAVGFDAERLRVTTDPVIVLDSVDTKGGFVGEFAVAPNGTMAYLRGSIGTPLLEVDRRGNGRTLIPTVQTYNSPRLSPDGRRLALAIGQPPYTSDIWVQDLTSGTLTRLTADGSSGSPEWTPDGRRLAWSSVAPGREGIWWQPWDASAPAALLIPGAQGPKFTRRGNLVLARFGVSNGAEVRLVTLPFDPTRPATVLLPVGSGDRQYRLSPDEHWLAYVSDETGVREIYVQPFPGPGGRFQISNGGGAAPTWSPNGKELFYRGGCCLIAATIATAVSPTVIRRDTLFTMAATRSMYEVTPDGNHFIMARLTNSTSAPVLVFGWADEVRARVMAAAKK